MERQLPKNVRQIGNVSDSPKIYVEDYVDTFFTQLCEKSAKAGGGPIGAFLVGDILKSDEEEYVYIYGAIRMHELKMEGNEYVIDEATWKNAYEDCKQYFEDGGMLGWFVAHQGVPLTPDAATVRLHKKSFPKKNTVFVMKDPVEKDETYYVHKMNDLMEIGGHYTYYEKNPCMQNYMISTRKKNGVFPSETVEDRAAKDFRNMVRTRSGRQRQRRSGSLMYAVSACLVLVLIVMGVSMVNNFDKMKSVQTTLDNLSAGASETVETSGTVTAVTPGEEDGTGDTQDSAEAEDSGSKAEDAQAENDGSEDNASDKDSKPADQSAEVTSDQGDTSQSGQSAETSDSSESAEASSDAQSSGESSGENGSDGVYIVEKGDTLAIISRKMYGDISHVDAICRMNGIEDGDLIYVGQKLLLP